MKFLYLIIFLVILSCSTKDENITVLKEKNLESQMIETYNQALEEFEKGDVIQYKRGSTMKYGRIVCFVHPDGLYSTSHEEGYNGKDLLECVEIDKKPGLLQKTGPDGEPKRFQAQGDLCKIMEVITVNAKGEPTTMHRLNIPEHEM